MKVLRIVLTAASGLVGVWVFTILWAWFAVPVFGVRQLTFPQGAGLMILSGVPRAYASISREAEKLSQDPDKPVKLAKDKAFALMHGGMILLGYPILLGMGWLWHWAGR